MGDYLNELIFTGISALVGAAGWLVRTVLTNQKQIVMLQTEIRDRDKRRDEDRQLLKELKADVNEVKRDILEIYRDKL